MKLKDSLSNTHTNTIKTQDLTGLPTAQWVYKMDEAHSFWDEFLQIFPIRRRQFARHEARGIIGLFWPGIGRDVACNVSTLSLADLCDLLKMPESLLALHKQLDLALDVCYGIKEKVSA